MSMRGEQQAIAIAPPTIAGDAGAPASLVFTTADSGPQALGVVPGWLTYTADADCRVAFWSTNGATFTALTTSSFPLWAKYYREFFADGVFIWVRVQGLVTGGTFYWHGSSR